MSDKIVELVNLFHEYEKAHPSASLEDFCRSYLIQQNNNKQGSKMFSLTGSLPIHKVLGRAFGRISKIGFFYGKRIMAELQLNSLDEFLYLEGVERMGTPTKKELIETYISEYSSGIEIIKRLVKMELLTEFPDEEDRRISRVKITKKGKKVLEACYPNMQTLGHMLYNPLTEEEKQHLAALMTKLDYIHYTAYSLSKNKTIDEMQELVKSIVAKGKNSDRK